MRVLGVSCDFHDAAAALVIDGEIIAAAEQERFSRIKHDPAMPIDAIASVLAIAGLTADDINLVAFHEKPLVTLSRIIAARQSAGPSSFTAFCSELPQFLRRNLFVSLRIERALRDLGATKRPSIRFAEHHLSHAGAAFYPSPFTSAAVLTIDGIGEWATATIGRGVGSHLDLLEEQRYPNSIGLFYSAITEFCGFSPNDGEYKLMGLAPFGEPLYVERLREIIEIHENGSVTIDLRKGKTWSRSLATLEHILERPRRQPGDAPTQQDADIARSAQVLVEEAVLRMAQHAHDITGESNLCLAGGVALNCVANGRIAREGPFDNVWVQPAAGDAGSALGAALWLSHAVEGVGRTSSACDDMLGACLGPAMAPTDIATWLDESGIEYRRLSDVGERAEVVAEALENGRYVGWFEGRMEFGPRALGHRSILADPRSPHAQSELNVRVKGRESFRPFAPAVLEEHAGDWFGLEHPSPYMLFTAPLSEHHRHGDAAVPGGASSLTNTDGVPSEVPSCTHVDGSARVQTVSPQRSDGFRVLVETFHRRTDCPMILNTSFNRAGEPIVCTPDDALATAVRSNLDMVVLEDCIVEVSDIEGDVQQGSWPQAPRQISSTSRRREFNPFAAISIALPGPAMFVFQSSGIKPALSLSAGVCLAITLMRAAGDNRWYLRTAVAVAVGAITQQLHGPYLGSWLAILLIAIDMVLSGRSMGPLLPAGDPEALPALVSLSLVSAWIVRDPAQLPRVRLVLVAMVVIVTLTSLFPHRLQRSVGRLSKAAGNLAARCGAAVVWVIGIFLPWAANSIVRVDPLRGPLISHNSSWLRRDGGGARPRDLWRSDPIEMPTPWTWKVRRAAGAVVLVTAVGLIAVALTLAQQHKGPMEVAHSNTDPNATPAAFRGAEWFPDYSNDIAWLWRTSVSWDPLAPVRLRDVSTRYVNIVDGARTSWKPPACKCKRLTVWMYGGSTTFGLGQRDRHTIASALARVAWGDNIAIEIQNRGVVGDHHWEEANRFAWDLATLDSPDLVLFLDGINDVQAVDRMHSDTRQPLSFIKDDFWQNYLLVTRGAGMDPRWAPDSDQPNTGPEGATIPTSTPLDFTSAEDAGKYVAKRFEIARKISAASAKGAGVPAVWFWQPAIENRPAIEGEPIPAGREWSLLRYRTAAKNVGADVHDISNSLDDITEPLYWDQFHTNEKGADLVARAMYKVLKPQLRHMSETTRR